MGWGKGGLSGADWWRLSQDSLDMGHAVPMTVMDADSIYVAFPASGVQKYINAHGDIDYRPLGNWPSRIHAYPRKDPVLQCTRP